MWSHQKHKHIEIKLNTLSIHFSPSCTFICNIGALQRAPFRAYGENKSSDRLFNIKITSLTIYTPLPKSA